MLQAVILEHGIPGVEWLMMRSPLQSPMQGQPADASPRPAARSLPGPSPARHTPHLLPAEPPTRTPPGMSHFQAACAALHPAAAHAESGGSSSPLALCAPMACQPPAPGHGCVPATAGGADVSRQPTSSTQAVTFAGSAIRAAVVHPGQLSCPAPALNAGTHTGVNSKLGAMPLQTPQRSAQHARAHVATPVDLQKLLQGGSGGREQAPGTPGGRLLGHLGPIKASCTPVGGTRDGQCAAVQVSATAEAVKCAHSAQRCEARRLEQGTVPSVAVDVNVGESSRIDRNECRTVPHTHWLQHGMVAEASVKETMANLIKGDSDLGQQGLAAMARQMDGLASKAGNRDGVLALDAAGRLGVGACIPGPHAASILSDQQALDMQQSSALPTHLRLDPGIAATVAPTPLQHTMPQHGIHATAHQEQAAVQSLWLWAGTCPWHA